LNIPFYKLQNQGLARVSSRSVFSPAGGKTQNKAAVEARQKQLFGMTLPSGGHKVQLYVLQEGKILGAGRTGNYGLFDPLFMSFAPSVLQI